MPRVTYTAVPLVWIEVRGEKASPSHGNRDDGGLISQLLEYLGKSNIFHARVGGMVGPGRFSFGFHPDDGVKVSAWLAARGIPTEDMDLVWPSAHVNAALAAGGET